MDQLHDIDSRELFIYDDIGPAWAGMVSAEGVRASLKALGAGPVTVRVNSYGGSVDEALAMLENLDRHNGEITVTVDSIAASAASLFPVAFQSSAASHSRVMIHHPWTIVAGNANQLRKEADVLDKYGDSIASVYMAAFNGEPDELRQMLDDETWMSAAEAVEFGFVGSVTEPSSKVEAKRVAKDRFRNTPADLISSDVESTIVDTDAEKTTTLIAAKLKIRARKLRNLRMKHLTTP